MEERKKLMVLSSYFWTQAALSFPNGPHTLRTRPYLSVPLTSGCIKVNPQRKWHLSVPWDPVCSSWPATHQDSPAGPHILDWGGGVMMWKEKSSPYTYIPSHSLEWWKLTNHHIAWPIHSQTSLQAETLADGSLITPASQYSSWCLIPEQ